MVVAVLCALGVGEIGTVEILIIILGATMRGPEGVMKILIFFVQTSTVFSSHLPSLIRLDCAL